MRKLGLGTPNEEEQLYFKLEKSLVEFEVKTYRSPSATLSFFR